MIKTRALAAAAAAVVAVVTFTVPVFAMNPELAVPDQVGANLKACQELLRIAGKYGIAGVFKDDFLAGKCRIDRLDVAVAVQFVSEKIAEKAGSEGTAAVDKQDLLVLSDLKEELRGEMLLAQSRAFQWRYGPLGTELHSVTKSIALSGGLVGVVQGGFGARPRDAADVVGRGDLVFNFKVGSNTIAVIDVEATGGNGLDARITNHSILNGVAGSTGDRARFREAWIEHSAFGERLTITAGKVDLTNYFDVNAVANDENTQFLAGAFVNSAVLGAPIMGPGARVQAKLSDNLSAGFGYASGDADGADIFDHGFGIGELECRSGFGGREGSFRVYGSIDGARPDGTSKLVSRNAVGYGVSLDQQVSDRLSVFFRYGGHERRAYATAAAWSAGAQYLGPIPARSDDAAGVAFGQVRVTHGTAAEKLIEAYYRARLGGQISVSPHFQYLISPDGDRNASDIFLVALRTQVTF